MKILDLPNPKSMGEGSTWWYFPIYSFSEKDFGVKTWQV
jgi:hypothetical protein